MCGSLVPELFRTESKKVSVVIFTGPAPPFLVKAFKRPLTMMRICVGPIAPMLSGGMSVDSDSCTPRKLLPGVCGSSGRATFADKDDRTGGGHCDSAGEFGFWGSPGSPK